MDFLLALYLALAAFVANMIPIPLARWNIFEFLNIPLDNGKTFQKKPILGKNKTWRGLVSGIILGAMIGVVQYFLDTFDIIDIVPIDSLASWMFFGALAGFGALFGDMVKSFWKRQIGIPSGKPFIPFDQIDYILGFFLFTFSIVPWSILQILFLVGFALVMNPLINTLSYFLGIKKTYW